MAFQYTITSNGLQLLRESLRLPTEPSELGSVRDAIFVSIDFENASSIKESARNFQGQLGVAILDTGDLVPSSSGSIITTYNFVTGPSSYCTSATRKFLFGKTIMISQQDMITRLESIIARTKDIILVGHDFRHDLQVLRHLNFDIQTSVLGILDTMRIASEVIPTCSGTLRDILRELQCPFDKLHSAGNDAHFTLRALLLLAVKSYADKTLRHEDQQRLESIRAVAQFHLPQQPESHDRGRKKKMKRFQRSRKHQAKLWDIDTQERIRAERAARRGQGTEQPSGDAQHISIKQKLK